MSAITQIIENHDTGLGPHFTTSSHLPVESPANVHHLRPSASSAHLVGFLKAQSRVQKSRMDTNKH